MNEFNTRFEGLNEAQKQARYQRLAQACLTHYALPDSTVTFVAHNAGIVYRVEPNDGDRRYILKIAQATGDGAFVAEGDPLNSVFLWLDAIARETTLTVQQPVASGQGKFIASVEFDDLSTPFYCSLQRWLDGEHPRDPSAEQVYQIGAMAAALHTHGSGWIQRQKCAAWQYDEIWLQENFEMFAVVKTLDILSDVQWNNVEKAVERILQRMAAYGKAPDVYGPIHSDLHQGNLVMVEGQMCPIDFGGLILGHYGLELGLTLYHLMYLNEVTRRALVAGYRANRELTLLSEMDFEAFLCTAALANLAFNATLPDHRTSRLFIRNVREFAGKYCDYLVRDIPFALEPYNYVF